MLGPHSKAEGEFIESIDEPEGSDLFSGRS
jgi:hypothetical protein